MGVTNRDTPSPHPHLRSTPRLSREKARSPLASGDDVPRSLPDEFIDAPVKVYEDRDAGKRKDEGPADPVESESEAENPVPYPPGLRLPRRSASPRLASILPNDFNTCPPYSSRSRVNSLQSPPPPQVRELASRSESVSPRTGGSALEKDTRVGDIEEVPSDEEGNENENTHPDGIFDVSGEERLVERRRRYPLTTLGGYAPTHLRQQFCLIDHPPERVGAAKEDQDESVKPKKTSLLSRILSFGRSSKPKAASSGSTTTVNTIGTAVAPAIVTTRVSPPDKWWKWEIRATYQRPFSMGPDGSMTSTPSGAHVELSVWIRADIPLTNSIIWGVPWRKGRRDDLPDVFGDYEGCARHPKGALGRWGHMLERRAYYTDQVKGDWTARASVVHDDRVWLEKVAPEELISMEAANTIEVYDTAHELCFLLDANTNQFWVLKNSIPDEKGQWIGDNIWNIIHGFDEGNWVRRSMQYRKHIK